MEARKRVLIIDDDAMICDWIEDLLSTQYTVLKATDAADGMATIKAQAPDLLVLDIKLRNQSGLDLCQTLREDRATRRIPILIYSGSEDIEALTTAFERGADDFVAKSARPQELVARIAAKIRRLDEQVERKEILRCGNLLLDDRKLEARIDGRPVGLSVLEYNLLRFFVINKERLVNREQILDGVWKGSIVSNRTIDTHMVYVRKKLAGFDHTLATVYGAGYILRDQRSALD